MTVVAFTADSERAPGAGEMVDSCGTFTATFRPVGVLPASVGCAG
jgi:hypothetical protein